MKQAWKTSSILGMQFLYRFSLTVVAVFALSSFATWAKAERKYLFQWDEGSGTSMSGWTWYPKGNSAITSQHPGWILNEDGPFGGSVVQPWGPSPLTFESGGYGSNNLAMIDTSDRAPSTSAGGALRLYENPETLDTAAHLISWWVWYDGQPLSERGITDSSTDRWSFYIKLHGITGASSEALGASFHVGTYACAHSDEPTYGTGDGCPYEGPGNQHYYHYLRFSPGAWLHVELDQHPQHRRGSHVAGNNPTMITNGFNYMEHLNQWYMEIRYPASQETDYLLDEMYFYSTQDSSESSEPQQNDESITSVWVGYWPSTGKWQIFWNDMSYETSSGEGLNDVTLSTFQVRWSTAPITNTNFESATLVNPEWYGGPEYAGAPNLIRRFESWVTYTFTQFELPDDIEAANDVIYFAIKDVSAAGGHRGTRYPWNRTDGHDAPSQNIRTIDYHLRPTRGTTPATISPPTSLRVRP